MFECRIRKERFPKEGELVIGKVISLKDGVVTLELLEYGNAQGLVLSGELSKKKFKSVSQLTKIGNIEACQVLKVEEDKGFIDLSLKKVSDEEKQEIKDAFSKAKLAYQIVAKACKMSGESIKDVYENWVYNKQTEYGSLFQYFVAAKNDLDILDQEPNGEYFKRIIEEQFKATTFKVRIDVEVTCNTKGVTGIKQAFQKATDFDHELEITLLKSPIYSILKISDDKDEAFATVNTAGELVKNEIESIGGTFNITNPAKIYGEKARHTILDQTKHEIEDDSSDE